VKVCLPKKACLLWILGKVEALCFDPAIVFSYTIFNLGSASGIKTVRNFDPLHI